MGTTDTDADPDTNREVDDTDDGKIPYTVKIRATDPSGAFGEKEVTVILKDVNEAPEFNSGSKKQATLYIDENATSDRQLLLWS